jgi:hypothetical protein
LIICYHYTFYFFIIYFHLIIINLFKVNENIIHNTFGQGKIVNITGSENDRKLIIHFIGYGPKVLLERLAKEKMAYTDKFIDIPSVEVEKKTSNDIHSNQLNDRSNSIDKMWIINYERLKDYLENNSNPNYKCPDTGKRYSFYFWLCKQKRLFRNGYLNQDKSDILNQIVDLNESKGTSRTSSEVIHTKLSNLLSFVKAGNPLYKHQDSQVYYQRLLKLESQENKIKQILLEIKSFLNSKGSGHGTRKIRWEKKYNTIFEYVKKNKKMIPHHIDGNYKEGKANKLYRWYYVQKGRYNNNKLSVEYVEKFSKLIELVSNADNTRIYNLRNLNERLGNLKEYLDRNILPPCINKDGSRNKLRTFLNNQLNFFRSGKMPSERIDQFKTIGLDLESFRHKYKKRFKINEEDLLDILNDIYLHLKEGKSMASHPERHHFYRRSSDKKREGQNQKVQKLIENIKAESNKQKIEKPIIILKRILEHVELGESINSHPSSSIYYTREGNYDIQVVEVQSLLGQIQRKLNQNISDKTKQKLVEILNHVKVGHPIYLHPNSAVYYGRNKNKENQTTEIQELLNDINIFIKSNSQSKRPFYVLSEILEFVKSGGIVNEHAKSNYYYSRLDNEDYLEQDISFLIKEINYFMDLNQFSDEE